ncbi:hypothetical protein [Anaerotignum sp.]|uniref:hypothetical protein n=1 Tax=Anaerotignum sp. TaxID=2039241 RepID=UPI003321BCD3
MSTFQKRETMRELRILGKWYSVDFGKDSIALTLRRVQEKLEEIEKKERGSLGQAQLFTQMMEEEKALLKEAIGEILGDGQDISHIFETDDTAVMHRDVYTFLVEEYIQVMRGYSPYDLERIEGL